MTLVNDLLLLTAMPHGDQTWGCATCGPNYMWAMVYHYYGDGVLPPWNFGPNDTFAMGVTAKTEQKLFTGGNANFCVGQNVQFALGGLPAGVMATNFQWTLDGTYVNTNLPPLYSDASSTYTLETNLLKSETTHAWWYDGKYTPLPSTASFTEDLTFANGQTVTVNASGLFTMHRPEIWLHQTNAIYEALAHQHDGGTQPSPNVDMLKVFNCYETNWIRSRFSGQAFITQTFTGTLGSAETNFDSQGTNYLDNSETYGDTFEPVFEIHIVPDVLTNYLPFQDGPKMLCNGHTWHHSQFSTYIRFQPDGGIPVTIGIFQWHNDGETSLTNIYPGSLVTDYYPVVPASNGGYTNMPIPEAKFDAFTGDNTFPTWLHTYHNY
jgi:hypothetical protein